MDSRPRIPMRNRIIRSLIRISNRSEPPRSHSILDLEGKKSKKEINPAATADPVGSSRIDVGATDAWNERGNEAAGFRFQIERQSINLQQSNRFDSAALPVGENRQVAPRRRAARCNGAL